MESKTRATIRVFGFNKRYIAPLGIVLLFITLVFQYLTNEMLQAVTSMSEHPAISIPRETKNRHIPEIEEPQNADTFFGFFPLNSDEILESFFAFFAFGFFVSWTVATLCYVEGKKMNRKNILAIIVIIVLAVIAYWVNS